MATAGKRNRMMNRSRILRVIWHHPGTSRIDVAAMLGLDKSTVSSIVTELLETGLVREVSRGEPSPRGGRRRVHLEIDNTYGYVLGVELQPGFFRAVLTDLTGESIKFWSAERPRDGRDFEPYLLELLNELLEDIGPSRERLIGIGVAMGGLVNSIRNVIYRSIPMEIVEEYDFQRRIAETVGIPVIAENDANACACATAWIPVLAAVMAADVLRNVRRDNSDMVQLPGVRLYRVSGSIVAHAGHDRQPPVYTKRMHATSPG